VTPEEVAASNITAIGFELIDAIGNPNVTYSEDCLYLNVWTKPQTGDSKKAVMIFIYGGAFDSGTSSYAMLSGAFLADHEDVIIVNFKYGGIPYIHISTNAAAAIDYRFLVSQEIRQRRKTSPSWTNGSRWNGYEITSPALAATQVESPYLGSLPDLHRPTFTRMPGLPTQSWRASFSSQERLLALDCPTPQKVQLQRGMASHLP
jgi:hypothetical protein